MERNLMCLSCVLMAVLVIFIPISVTTYVNQRNLNDVRLVHISHQPNSIEGQFNFICF